MENKVFYVIFGFFLYVGLVIFAIPNERILSEIEKERKTWLDTYDSKKLGQLVTDARVIYNSIVYDSDLDKTVRQTIIPTVSEKKRSGSLEKLGSGLFDWLDLRWKVLGFFLYHIICRVLVLKLWCYEILIWCLVCLFSGYCRRKVIQSNFELPSTLRGSFARKAIVFLLIVLAVNISCPFAFPVLVAPLLCILIMPVIGIWIANLQKRL